MVHVVTKMLTRKDMTLTSSYVLPKGILQTKQYSKKDCIFLSDIPVSARQNGSKSDLKNTHQVHGFRLLTLLQIRQAWKLKNEYTRSNYDAMHNQNTAKIYRWQRNLCTSTVPKGKGYLFSLKISSAPRILTVEDRKRKREGSCDKAEGMHSTSNKICNQEWE